MRKLDCPLCEAHSMELITLKSENRSMKNKSYMWICEECPGVLMEWYLDSDQKAFNKFLSGDTSDVIPNEGEDELHEENSNNPKPL